MCCILRLWGASEFLSAELNSVVLGHVAPLYLLPKCILTHQVTRVPPRGWCPVKKHSCSKVWKQEEVEAKRKSIWERCCKLADMVRWRCMLLLVMADCGDVANVRWGDLDPHCLFNTKHKYTHLHSSVSVTLFARCYLEFSIVVTRVTHLFLLLTLTGYHLVLFVKFILFILFPIMTVFFFFFIGVVLCILHILYVYLVTN